MTELDHHANVAPWQALARERGLVLRWLPFDRSSGRLLVDRFADAARTRAPGWWRWARRRTRLGTITDVTPLARLAHQAGALVFVDAVHLAPHVLPDVAALECDLLACSTYKFYGPARRRAVGPACACSTPSTRHDSSRRHRQRPERLETGTQNHEGIIGGAAAVHWLAALAGIVRARSGPGSTPVIASCIDGPRSCSPGSGTACAESTGSPCMARRRMRLAPRRRRSPWRASRRRRSRPDWRAGGCFVSHGDFYAATVIERLGLASHGLVRAGLAAYATADEVDRLLGGRGQL